QAADDEGPVGPARPASLRDRAVVEQVGRLDAGAHRQGGPPGQVLPPHQLGVLDRAPRPGGGEDVEDRGDRPVAGGAEGQPEPRAPVAARTSMNVATARSPLAWRASSSPAPAARAATSVSSPSVRLSTPVGCSRAAASAYGSAQHAVRVLSEPSVMTLSGP